MWEAGDHASDLSLPFLTGFLASPALSLGAFGLVWRPLTNAYHPPDLGSDYRQAPLPIVTTADKQLTTELDIM